MKALILFLIILITTPAISSNNPIDCYGYWIVTYDTENGMKKIPTVDLVDVYTVAENYLPGNCIDFEKKLKEQIAFEFSESGIVTKTIWIEVKKINHNGKLKRLTKKEVQEYLERWKKN